MFLLSCVQRIAVTKVELLDEIMLYSDYLGFFATLNNISERWALSMFGHYALDMLYSPS